MKHWAKMGKGLLNGAITKNLLEVFLTSESQ